MERQSKPPSQNWRTFPKNHAEQIAAIDFFTVPAITFGQLERAERDGDCETNGETVRADK